jgi:hypothetical protein
VTIQVHDSAYGSKVDIERAFPVSDAALHIDVGCFKDDRRGGAVVSSARRTPAWIGANVTIVRRRGIRLRGASAMTS